MKRLIWLFLCAALFAQNNQNVIVVGNPAQPVSPIHWGGTNPKTAIQDAINKAGVNGVVIIPADYAGTDSFTNPNSILLVDLRGNTLGVNSLLVNGVPVGSMLYPNSATGAGTVCNGLAKVDQIAGQTTLGKATPTLGGEVTYLGVVSSGCGTSGFSTIVMTGLTQALFDSNTPTVGNAVGISIGGSGLVTDLGSAQPTGKTVIGIVTLSPTGGPSGATCTIAPGCWILLFPGGGGSGGGGSPFAVVTNPALTATNTIVPTVSTVQPITSKCPSSAAGTLDCAQVTDSSGTQLLGVQQNGIVQVGKSGGPVVIATGTASNTDLDGTLTMSGGTGTYTFNGTYTSHPTCTASDETAIAAVKVTYTGVASVTFTTSGGSDVVDYHCFGRN